MVSYYVNLNCKSQCSKTFQGNWSGCATVYSFTSLKCISVKQKYESNREAHSTGYANCKESTLLLDFLIEALKVISVQNS